MRMRGQRQYANQSLQITLRAGWLLYEIEGRCYVIQGIAVSGIELQRARKAAYCVVISFLFHPKNADIVQKAGRPGRRLQRLHEVSVRVRQLILPDVSEAEEVQNVAVAGMSPQQGMTMRNRYVHITAFQQFGDLRQEVEHWNQPTLRSPESW